MKLSPNEVVIGVCYTGYCAAYLYMHKFKEAIEWGQRALRQPAALPWPGYTFLISALANDGQHVEAKALLSKLLEIQPNISLSFVQEHTFTNNKEQRDLLHDGLRKAGLPKHAPSEK